MVKNTNQNDKILDKPVELNILNWHSEDKDYKKFIIYGFGKSASGENAIVQVENFKPEMYIRIRLNSKNNNDKNKFMYELDNNTLLKNNLLDNINYICDKPIKCKQFESEESCGSCSDDANDEDLCCCLAHNPPDLLQMPLCVKKQHIRKELCTIENKKDLYESFGNNDIIVLKIVFNTVMAFNRLKKALKSKISNFDGSTIKNDFIMIDNHLLKERKHVIDMYKSDLQPLLDFFHNKNIQPCGWIKFDKIKKHIKNDENFSNDVYSIHFNNIEAVEKYEFAPFKIMSWDIEADSSHGDFPLAIKNYKKFAMEMTDFYLDYINKNKSYDEKTLVNIFKCIINTGFNISHNSKLDTQLQDKIKLDISQIYLKNKLNTQYKNLLKSKEFINELLNICNTYKNKSKGEISKSNLDYLFLKNNTQQDFDDYDNDENINNKMSNRDIIIYLINKLLEDKLPEVQGDRIIQIGCVFHNFGIKNSNKKYILTLGSCDKFDDDTCIFQYGIEKNVTEYNVNELDNYERELILKFQEVINSEQPDIIMGYNTFGFDNKFLFNRVQELDITEFGYISKIKSFKSELQVKMLSSSALGDNILNLITNTGRTELDLLKIVQRDHNLDSYSLNNVSQIFIGDEKDDVTPKQIFMYQRLNSEKRAVIAKYCIKDCVLLIDLMNKLDILSANIGMANVCSVPLSYIILRGQGIKIQSLVSKECKNENYILRELEKKNDDSSYEGAIVLPPIKGMYLEEPVSVLDYASLYPSSMIASNISHEGIVKTEIFKGKDANLEEIEEINLQNIKNGIEFRNYQKYTEKIEDFDAKAFEEELKSYNKFPLLDSIYVKSLKKRFIRKCKCNLFITEKYYNSKDRRNINDMEEFKKSCKDLYTKLSHEEKQKYELNVYYPLSKFLDSEIYFSAYENIDYVNYIKICFDTYKGKGDKKEKVGVKRITFAHPVDIEQYDDVNTYPDQTISKRGIMPKILRKLLKARKDTRKKIPLEKDEFKKGVLEGLQLGYKLSANSLYGQCGASTSAIFKQDVAAATTSTGRQMLNLCSSFAKQYYDCTIVYGDSVTGDEPLILRNSEGLIEIKTIESLSQIWETYENFKPFDTIQSNRRDKQKSFVNYEVFANNKWNPIKKVIRHKTNKKIYRVNTHCGVVDVTEDHSLLNSEREKIKPCECIVGETELFHCFPNEFNEIDAYVPQQNEEKEKINREELIECTTCKNSYSVDNYYFADKLKTKRCKQCKICIKRKRCEKKRKIFNEEIQSKEDIYKESYLLTEEEAKIWGMFMGDGSCGCYNSKWSFKYSWALNNNNLKRLNTYKDLLEKIEPVKFKILDTLKSSGVYKLVPVGSLKYMVKKYRSLLYYEKAKIVPNIVLNSKLEIRKAFFEGYYDADGGKTGNYGLDKTLNFVTKNKISAQCLYYLAKSIGYNKLSLNIQEKKVKKNTDYYWISSCKNYRKNPNILKKIIYLRDSQDEYVYDLETEQGTFCAGVGELELKNTDSCFLKYNTYVENDVEIKDKERLRYGIQKSICLSDDIRLILRKPHDLEYEKTFYPFILFSKKRYIGYLYEEDWTITPKLKYMGIVLKRRDNANIVKIFYKGIITRLLEDKTIDSAVKFLQEKLEELINGQFKMEDLTITKTLRGYYKNPEGIAHKVLADRMGERDPGNKPSSNDRIPFVYINVKEKKGQKILQGDRVEHPDYIRENNLKINYKFYITNQLQRPIMQIFELCLKDPSEPFQIILNKLNREVMGCKDISSYFK